MIFNKKELRDTIYLDIASENLELISETEEEITVWDLDDGKSTRFTFEEYITEDWLSDKIYVNPEARNKFEATPQIIASILLENLPTEYFITLNKVYVIYSQSDLALIDNECYDGLGITSNVDFIWEESSGVMLFEKNIIVVNMKQLERECDRLNYGRMNIKLNLISTLFHEFRHLMLDTNIYLPWSIYPEHLASEEAVGLFEDKTTDCMLTKLGLT